MRMEKSVFLFLSLLFALWLLVPQLKVPWMLIDDGESLRVAQEIDKKVKAGNFSGLFWVEKENGRLRPFYWVYHFFTFKLFRFNAFFHHLAHLLVYLLIAFLIYKILLSLFGQALTSMLGVVFFLFFPPAFENFYRLGTAEPVLTLYLLLLLYFLIKKRLFLTIFFLALLYFTKETAIVLLPASIIFYVLSFFLNEELQEVKAWRRFFLAFLFANLILAFTQRLIIAKLGISGFYSAYYSFSLPAVFRRFLAYVKIIFAAYHLFLLIGTVSFLTTFTSQFFLRKKMNFTLFWQTCFLCLFFLFLAAQAPWAFVMGRYLPPALIGLVPSLAVGNARLIKFLLLKKGVLAKGLLFCFIFLFFYFVFLNTKKVMAMYTMVFKTETQNSQAVAFLAKNAPLRTRIFYNFSDGAIEYLYEMPLHFRFFHQRDDIQTDFFLLEKPFVFKKGDFLVSWKPVVERYPLEKIRAQFQNLKEIKKIDNTWHIFRFINDENYYPSSSF